MYLSKSINPRRQRFQFPSFYATQCRGKADWGKIQETDNTYSLEINCCLRLETFGSDSSILKFFSVFFFSLLLLF